MAHSHLPVQHLIRQVETRRTLRQRRDARPQWVTQFIDTVADCFEPLADVGRVGFFTQPDDNGWLVTMYLGRTEIVGGKEDGTRRPMSFHFDLQAMASCFSQLTALRWTACPDVPASGSDDPGSVLRAEGLIDGKPLRLIVTAVPPETAGPGLRQYPDGSCNPA